MLRLGLEQQGYVVRDLPDGRGIDGIIGEWQPDAIVLDVMMPFADGFTLLPVIRRRTQAPIIMLTAKTDVDDRVTGLSLGADDYVLKASNEGSLDRSMARLQAELVPKIKQFFHVPGQVRGPAAISTSHPSSPSLVCSVSV
jgi:DNA-binding response OmpR family regulator